MIYVQSIPDAGMAINAHSADAAWAARMLDGLSLGEGSSVQIALQVFCGASEQVDVIGHLDVCAHLSCDRCVEAYVRQLHVPINLFLAPGTDEGFEDCEDDSAGDVSFSTYANSQIQLEVILTEQLNLAIPMQSLCREECLGLCARCGESLNDASCSCAST